MKSPPLMAQIARDLPLRHQLQESFLREDELQQHDVGAFLGMEVRALQGTQSGLCGFLRGGVGRSKRRGGGRRSCEKLG